MKTKREILKTIAEKGNCYDIGCNECPYYFYRCIAVSTLKDNLARIGAKAILRMFPEKREFDKSKILTGITADKAKVGMKGYFDDNLSSLRNQFERRVQTTELVEILDERYMCRFRHNDGLIYSLFYPIDEVEE